MRYINREMLVIAIDEQPEIFDSHAIEKHIYRSQQAALVRELHGNIDHTYPFTETCRQIGLELSRMTDIIVKIDEVSTTTFSGEDTPCARWRKRTP